MTPCTATRIEFRREVTRMLRYFPFLKSPADVLRRREEGQTMAEYSVVLAVITLAVIGAFTLLGGAISGALDAVAGILP